MKIAFVYDWFDTEIGGAERVLQVLHSMYPDAPWYTSHIDHKTVTWTKDWDIRPSFLQSLPLWFRRNRILSLPLLPFAFESFDLSHYDVVISVSSGFAKNVITTANTKHICYLLTPPRWLYKGVPNSKFQIPSIVAKWIRRYLKSWDRVGAQRVDEYISISNEVARRCKEYYGRESEVIYPPFDFHYWQNLSHCYKRGISPPSTKSRSRDDTNNLVSYQFSTTTYPLPPKPYFLIVSRLEPYKKVDLAIEAYARCQGSGVRGQSKDKNTKILNQVQDDNADRKLVIVGRGSKKDVLEALCIKYQVSNDVVWLESVTDEELARLYTGALALIMPQEEDFGYTACEAIACGCPVVVFARGGQVEIVEDGINGVHFDKQNPESLSIALEKVQTFEYNQEPYENSHIRGWSRNTFVAALSQKIPKTV